MTHTQKQTDTNITKLQKGSNQPTRNILSTFDELDNIFNQLKSRDWMHSLHWPDAIQSHIPMFSEGKTPKVDIIDRDKDLFIRAELPGVDKKDLDISMTDNTVTIKASNCYKNKEEKSDYYRCEISQGQYARTVGLPSDVNIEKAKTSFKDGVLELTVPKQERSQRRSIKVE